MNSLHHMIQHIESTWQEGMARDVPLPWSQITVKKTVNHRNRAVNQMLTLCQLAPAFRHPTLSTVSRPHPYSRRSALQKENPQNITECPAPSPGDAWPQVFFHKEAEISVVFLFFN